MRIGFDFDNTIVHYDKLFHKVAVEQGAIDDSVAVSKVAVRDYLRQAEREHVWTEMQGYVYGARMQEADSYPDVIDVMQRLKSAGHTLAIMSHKTKHPYKGKQYDLHAAARGWIEEFLVADGEPLIPSEQIFFEITKEAKWGRIGKFECDAFIDDLPEILLADKFPTAVQRFLFDPERHHGDKVLEGITVVSTWHAFERKVL